MVVPRYQVDPQDTPTSSPTMDPRAERGVRSGNHVRFRTVKVWHLPPTRGQLTSLNFHV